MENEMNFKKFTILLFSLLITYQLYALDFSRVFALGDLEEVKVALENINVEDTDDKGITPLIYASAFNTVDVVKYLIEEKEANYLYDNQHPYPFDMALAVSDQPKVIEYYISLKAPYGMKASFPTPLFSAIASNTSFEVFNYLLTLYPDINDINGEGQTLLIIAAQYNKNPDAIQFLLENGADITKLDNYKKSAYEYALNNQKLMMKQPMPDVVKKLNPNNISITNDSNKYSEIREFAKRKFPYDQSMQDYTFNEQVESYQYMQSITDLEIKKIAEEKYPTDYSMQKYIYEEQLDGKYFMQNVTDNEIKQIAYRKYPFDYSMQKYIYEEQIEGKKYMQLVSDYTLKQIAIKKYPYDYSMQKYIYNDQYEAKQYMSSRKNYYAKLEAEKKYPNDYTMQKYIYDELSTY